MKILIWHNGYNNYWWELSDWWQSTLKSVKGDSDGEEQNFSKSSFLEMFGNENRRPQAIIVSKVNV